MRPTRTFFKDKDDSMWQWGLGVDVEDQKTDAEERLCTNAKYRYLAWDNDICINKLSNHTIS